MCFVVLIESLYIPQNTWDKEETIHEKGERITRQLKEGIRHKRSLTNLIHGLHMTAYTARCRQFKHRCNTN